MFPLKNNEALQEVRLDNEGGLAEASLLHCPLVGEYAMIDDSVSTFTENPFENASSDRPRTDSISADPYPTMKVDRSIQWSKDASDEMIFHWLCPTSFNEKPLPDKRRACVVSCNPLYWLVFLMTFLSLWLGREFHLAFGQVDF